MAYGVPISVKLWGLSFCRFRKISKCNIIIYILPIGQRLIAFLPRFLADRPPFLQADRVCKRLKHVFMHSTNMVV